MMHSLTRLWCFYILFTILIISNTNAWYKSSFSINSKLPTECGRSKSYSPELRLQSWGAWPWLGLIQYDGIGMSRCNAVLIHPQAAISTVFCIKYIPDVILEDHLFIAFSSPALPSFQNISVTNIDFLGESYNTWSSISLMRLSRPAIISAEVTPICLWEQHQNWSDQISNHIGMMIGTDHESLYKTDGLRIYQAPVRIVPIDKCQASIEEKFREKLFATQLCFSYLRGPKECHSLGSPMMMPRLAEDGSVIWYLRALQSQRTWYCTGPDYLPAFDTARNRDWIESHFKSSVESGCGRRVVAHTALVTRGTEALRGDWPWHAAIYRKPAGADGQNLYQCGGSLISQRFILTAGHCVGQDLEAERFLIVLGKHNRDLFEAGQKEMQVSQVIRHENIEWTTLRNDIALMKMAEIVVYNDYIQPICIWDETDKNKESVFDRVGNVVGWGYNENGTLSPTLAVADIPITNDLICIQSNPNFYNTFLHDKTFCAGNPNGNGSGVCNGDSGGGLTLPITQGDHEISWFLRGIVSVSVKKVGANICDPKHYTIYTDVAKYTDWIANKMNETSVAAGLN